MANSRAGAGVEVGESLVGVGFDDGEGQGCDEHRVEDEYRGGEEVPAESVHDVGYCCEEQGPDNEDLPWMESDQKCWKGDFTEAFWA